MVRRFCPPGHSDWSTFIPEELSKPTVYGGLETVNNRALATETSEIKTSFPMYLHFILSMNKTYDQGCKERQKAEATKCTRVSLYWFFSYQLSIAPRASVTISEHISPSWSKACSTGKSIVPTARRHRTTCLTTCQWQGGLQAGK